MVESSNFNESEPVIIRSLDLSHLTLSSPIGRGSKGVVFRILNNYYNNNNNDEQQLDDLALKVISKSLIRTKKTSNSNGGGDGAAMRRVEMERKVLRETRHPLVARMRGVAETEEVVGFAIEYCSGGDLGTVRRMQSDKMFSDDVIRFYAAELVLALEYLHREGIVYRDLKPENLLIQSNGHIMLVDFDLSTQLAPKQPVPAYQPAVVSSKNLSSLKPVTPKTKRTKSNLARLFNCYNSFISPDDESVPSSKIMPDSVLSTESSDLSGKSNSFVGTEEYVAPEMIMGTGHDFSIDWWCLGVVLFEMLYGTTPFKGSNRKDTFYRVLTRSPELIGEATPLRDLIRRLLEKDPAKRITLEGIKGHEFFKGVDWDMILRLARPPYIPGRSEIDEGIERLNGAEVENIVRGIFEEIENNNKIVGEKKSNDDKSNGDKKNNGQSIVASKGVRWLEGLDHAIESHNFSVF